MGNVATLDRRAGAGKRRGLGVLAMEIVRTMAVSTVGIVRKLGDVSLGNVRDMALEVDHHEARVEQRSNEGSHFLLPRKPAQTAAWAGDDDILPPLSICQSDQFVRALHDQV